MNRLCYPVELHEAEDGVTATFPDMPYGVTCGATKKEALGNAKDCLEEIIDSMMKDKKAIPKPSAAHGRKIVSLSPAFSVKVLLYNALRAVY